MALTLSNSLPLVPVYLNASKPVDLPLVIRQGETIRQPIAVIHQSLEIASIVPGDEDNQVIVTTRMNHCLKECDRIILNGVQCRDACNDPDGCYMAAQIHSDTSFLIDGLTIIGDPTATCALCYGGQVLIPQDLTGTQTFAQIRQGHSAERYAPPIVAATIQKDSSVLAIPDCDGCPGIRKGDYIDIPEASIQAALVIRIEKSASRHCAPSARTSCKAIIDQVAIDDACKTKVTLHHESFANFTSEANDPQNGIIDLVLPASESQQIPIPWCENITLAKPDGRAAYGPHRWDLKLRSQQGDYWLAEGNVIMLPSTTVVS